MVVTPSHMIELGTPASDFSLLDTVSGNTLSLNELSSKTGTVIMFICNHCPFVKHILHRLIGVAKIYQTKGISFIAISSNDVDDYPQDSPEKMQELAKQLNFPFPYLYDKTQEIAKAYHATCTPDFYVYDKNLTCAYRGRFDDSTPGNNKPVSGHDLCAALDKILAEIPVDIEQHPSIGCNIKWKKRNIMTLKADNLIWIDLEMTGLDVEKNQIIEMATIVTSYSLDIVAESPVFTINQSHDILENMDEWNTRQHTSSGLLERVKNSTVKEAEAESAMLDFLAQYVPAGKSPMCGNSICQDRRFLYRYMPKLERYFHYRHLDVTTIKILAQHWAPSIAAGISKVSTHTALQDIRDSINELRYYRNYLFKL